MQAGSLGVYIATGWGVMMAFPPGGNGRGITIRSAVGKKIMREIRGAKKRDRCFMLFMPG
jgi:hypothetical protein